MKRQGFTLIEVLIAILILATLSVLSASGIQQAIRAKKKIQEQIDDVSRIRDAIRLMERDINLAFHYRDFEKEIIDAVKKQGKPPLQPGQPPPIPQAEERPEAPRLDPVTHFIGTEDSLNFVTMNHTQMVKDTKSADFAEVGYSLKDCRSIDGKTNSRCLWRRSARLVDSDVTAGGDELVLLENVTEFSLKYIGKGKQDWVSSWKTDKSSDSSTRNRFPQAVEISLTVQKGETEGGKKFSMQVVVPIHFPNNKEEGSNANTDTSAQDPSQPQSPTQ